MIFADDYIVFVPNYAKVQKHSHSMMHLFLSQEPIDLTTNKKHVAQMIALNSFILHNVEAVPQKTLLFLIDPTSLLGEVFAQKFLAENIYCASLPDKLNFFLRQALRGNLSEIFPDFWTSLGLNLEVKKSRDKRIETVISGIKDRSLLFASIPELAQSVFLSESRLTHLFKETTGMTLKNYLLMNQMALAFQLVQNNMSITEAAHSAGFYDAAHLANLVRKTTGISLSEVFR